MSDEFKTYLKKTGEIGRVVSIAKFIIWVSGLPGLRLNEMVICEDGQKGVVYGLEKDTAEVLMLDSQGLATNKAVTRTDQTFKISASFNLLGRIVDPLCRPIDGLGPILGAKTHQEIDSPAPSITQRARVKRNMETGVLKVDLLIPLGYGQRELIIGDKKTGKTTFLLQTIASQAKKEVVCIYVAIGKRLLDLRMIEGFLKEQGVFSKVVIVAATAADPSPIIYLAPYSGMSIAEFFRDNGNNVVIGFDDLSAHAKTYRELALLLKRFPGRSSYPGDIFHIHAKLLERAGNIKYTKEKEVSITALPVVNTLENDLAGYIQTNLMAITDGHIFFDTEEFRKGARPAINTFLSVSRVGNQTETPLEREIAGIIRKKMSEYKKALEIARFGVELPAQTKSALDFGKKLDILFFQESTTILKKETQLLLLGLLLSGYWQKKTLQAMEIEVIKILETFKKTALSEIEESVKKTRSLNELISLTQTLIPKIESLWQA